MHGKFELSLDVHVDLCKHQAPKLTLYSLYTQTRLGLTVNFNTYKTLDHFFELILSSKRLSMSKFSSLGMCETHDRSLGGSFCQPFCFPQDDFDISKKKANLMFITRSFHWEEKCCGDRGNSLWDHSEQIHLNNAK